MRILESNGTRQQVRSKEELKSIIASSPFNADLNNLDVSGITDMRELFANSKFNGDISGWDTSNVTTMESMFAHSSFNGDLSEWDTSNVQNMSFMFSGSDFNKNISRWNTESLRDAYCMFENTGYSHDLSKWKCWNTTSTSKEIDGLFGESSHVSNVPQWYGEIINGQYIRHNVMDSLSAKYSREGLDASVYTGIVPLVMEHQGYAIPDSYSFIISDTKNFKARHDMKSTPSHTRSELTDIGLVPDDASSASAKSIAYSDSIDIEGTTYSVYITKSSNPTYVWIVY